MRSITIRGLAVLAAALVFAVPVLGDWIRLGSWNIEHLGHSDEEETGAMALAEAIHLSGLDILAMEEIYDNDDAPTRTNLQLTKAFSLLNAIGGHSWAYEMLPNRSSGDKSQLVTIAWNQDRVTKVGNAFRIPVVRQASEWDRHPHAIKFSAGKGKTDIVVIPLHMKADFRGDFSAQRGLEARELADQLDGVRAHFGGEGDLVLIGDLNCDDALEPALQVFAGAGFRDLNSKDQATHIQFGPLDRVLVPKQEEFIFSRQYILTAADTQAFDRFLSDHQIIMTPIRVLADDD